MSKMSQHVQQLQEGQPEPIMPDPVYDEPIFNELKKQESDPGYLDFCKKLYEVKKDESM